MHRILITGGNGFIGTNLVHRLAGMDDCETTVLDIAPPAYRSLPPNVRFVQGDLSDTNLMRKIVVDGSIGMVYHLAWGTIHETATRDPLDDVRINIHSSLNLFEACVRSGVERIVYVSSGGTVYGVPSRLPVREDHPTNPINAYGISKLAVEKYLQMYAHLHGIEYVVLRPSVPYGPFQNPYRRQGAVTVFTYSALTDRPITIWGGEDIIRDYFYIDDLVDALLRVRTGTEAKNRIYNLAGRSRVSLDGLLTAIRETLNIDPVIRHEEERVIDVKEMVLDPSAAEADLGWRPRIDLGEGIRRTAEWLRENFVR